MFVALSSKIFQTCACVQGGVLWSEETKVELNIHTVIPKAICLTQMQYCLSLQETSSFGAVLQVAQVRLEEIINSSKYQLFFAQKTARRTVEVNQRHFSQDSDRCVLLTLI